MGRPDTDHGPMSGHFKFEGRPMSASANPNATSDLEYHPGTSGIWTFVFIDMVVFLLLFLVYISERFRLPDLFAASQLLLNPFAGLASALFLLTSSWCMVEAVNASRRNAERAAATYLNFALLLGALFAGNKLIEYADKFTHGVSPVSNGFFTFYFIITGLHFIHVVGGMCFMGHCRMRLSTELGSLNFRKKMENVGLFWHFVDVLWLFIFPMLYLAGAK
jgi:nitric oxide reductase NorE protein